MKKRKSSPENVLVIEDDAIIAMSIEDTLREAGSTRVTVCSSTTEAMKALRDGDYDVLVLDVHLADRDDGWAVAELVQELGASAPRIIFSTATPQDIPGDIAGLGIILEKPYTPEALVAAAKVKPARKFKLLKRAGR